MNQLVKTSYILFLSATTRLAGSIGRNQAADPGNPETQARRPTSARSCRAERTMRTDMLRRRRKARRGARHLVLIDLSAPRESGDPTRTTRSECRGLDGIGRVYRERSIG